MPNRESASVAIVRCSDYDRDRVGSAVRSAVDLLGGIRTFLKPGDRVLIKPNLLKPSLPDAAVITHPEVVRAVIRLVREAGAEALVGDSPGFGDARRVCERSGLMAVLEEEGAKLADMETAVQIRNQGRFRHFEIARSVKEADAVINLPKFKTHGMMTITGAVKNLFGCIPGRRKVQWHFNSGVDRAAFARMLVELSSVIKPRLTVMDMIVGMEGNGPGSGDPRPIGLILAGRDPVAVDALSGSLVGVHPALLHIPRAAAEAGIGEPRLEKIPVLGEPPQAVSVPSFRLPPQEHVEWPLPDWTRRLLKDALTTRPVIDTAACIRCGVCQGHCPAGAISDDGTRLTIRYRDCIRCFCCQEFCPRGAIAVGRGWALKLIR